MKDQFGMKCIPGDVWSWIEDQSIGRDVDRNTLICELLDYVRRGRSGESPLDRLPVVRAVASRNGSPPRDKDQFCLRSIPSALWRWIESESDAAGTSRKNFIVEVLRDVRDGIDQLRLFTERPVAKPAKASIIPFSFIDLFAGIGGFRLGLQRLGGKCVFTSEWDRFCQQTYEHWFGDKPRGDIVDVQPADIPEHDILAAGFPCQPFSIAGVSKKNSLGQKHGFDCERQGNLFFQIAEIAKAKRPKVMILENVKNLKSHDRGRTWPVILETLENLSSRTAYTVRSEIIDARHYVPQHRERIFIVCFRKDLYDTAEDFRFPVPPSGPMPKFREVLEERPDARYILTDHLWNYLQEYARKHRAKGNGFGFGMTDLDGVARTLSARYYKDGSEVLIPRRPSDPVPRDKGRRNPRRLTPLEAARLMGFGDVVQHRTDIPVSDTQAYKQFGNAVVPDVVEAVARQVLKFMASTERAAKTKRKSKRAPVMA